MNASSPIKRRVLGALDPNAYSPSKAARRHEGKLFPSSVHQQKSPTKVKAATPRPALIVEVTSPTRGACVLPSVSGTPEKEMEMGAESRKRRSPTPTLTTAPALESRDDGEPAAKRACLETGREEMLGRRAESPPSSSWATRTSGTTRHRSASPDTPSVFDHSAADNSQVTILTEPDTTAPAPVQAVAPLPAPRARPRLTREQAREKAEIIRLRLGLASYKVRTGQTDVPLDRLEAQHARASFSSPPLPSQSQFQTQGRNRSSTCVSLSFPPPANTSFTSTIATTPGRSASSRRPLPGAPLRRTSSSVSVSFEQDAPREAPPSRSVLYEEARLAMARDERRQQQQQQQQQQPYNQHHQYQLPDEPQLPRHNNHNSNNNNNNNNNYHQRRQSEALHTRHAARRYMHDAEYAAVPPRPRTAVGVTGSSEVSFGRTVSFAVDERYDDGRGNGRGGVVEGEEEDLEGRRGGAASGLLSLARS